MYLFREYFKGKVYTIWVQGPLGLGIQAFRVYWEVVGGSSCNIYNLQTRNSNP